MQRVKSVIHVKLALRIWRQQQILDVQSLRRCQALMHLLRQWKKSTAPQTLKDLRCMQRFAAKLLQLMQLVAQCNCLQSFASSAEAHTL